MVKAVKTLPFVALLAIVALGLFGLTAAGCSEEGPAVTIRPDGDTPDGDGSDGDTDSDGEGEDGDVDGDAPIDGDVDLDVDTNDYDNTALDLAEVPQSGVRGGVVSKSSELLGGPEADGRIGDFKLYNGKIAVIIAAPAIDESGNMGEVRGFASQGGEILDAVHLDEDGNGGDDLLVSALPIIGVLPSFLPIDGSIREFTALEAELIHNGSDGRAAWVRVTGVDGSLDLMEAIVENPSYPNPKVRLVIDYKLSVDAEHVSVTITTVLEDDVDDEFLREPVRPGLGVLTQDSMARFYPGRLRDGGERPEIGETAGYNPDFFAFMHPSVAYGVAASANKTIFALLHSFDLELLMVNEDVFASADSSPSETLLFVVGENDADSIYRIVNGRRQALQQPFAQSAVDVGGRVSLTTEFAGLPLEAVVMRHEAVEVETDGDVDAEGETVTERVTEQTRAYIGDDATYDVMLPPGDYEIFVQTPWGEEGASTLVTYAEEGGLPTLDYDLAAPPRPAKLALNITDDEGSAIRARVDFYQQADDEVAEQPSYTFYSGAGDILVPMGGAQEATFTVVISHGPFFGAEVQRDVVLKTGVLPGEEPAITAILTRQISKLVEYRLVTENVPAQDGVPAINHEMALISADWHVPNEYSIDTRFDQAERYAIAVAEDMQLVTDNPRNTVSRLIERSDAALLAGNGATELLWVPSVGVQTGWGDFTGVAGSFDYGIMPTGGLRWYGAPFVNWLANGGYAGRRPAPAIWQDLFTTYDVEFVQVNHPRTGEDGFFIYYGEGEDGTYDPAVGIDSLAFEAASTMDEWTTLELMDHRTDIPTLYKTMQDWFSLLAQGIYKPLTASTSLSTDSPAHAWRMGAMRTMIVSTEASAGKVENLIGLAAYGRSFVTTGPILTLSVGNHLPGDVIALEDTQTAGQTVDVRLTVQAADWVGVEGVSLCVDGQEMTPYHYWAASVTDTTRFDGTITVAIPAGDETTYRDTWITAMVFTRTSKPMAPVYPEAMPFAISNPILIEADGNPDVFKMSQDGEVAPDRSAPYCLSPVFCDIMNGWDFNGDGRIKKDCCGKYPDRAYCSE